MIVLVFTVTLRDPALRADFEQATAQMRDLALATPGCVSWQDFSPTPDETTGIVTFESEEALAAWRDQPSHAAIHERGRDALYRTYDVKICNVVRASSFDFAT